MKNTKQYTKQDIEMLVNWADNELKEWSIFRDKVRSANTNITLNYKELETVLSCLRYCRHRMYKHPDSGAQYLNKKKVENLITKLEKEEIKTLCPHTKD